MRTLNILAMVVALAIPFTGSAEEPKPAVEKKVPTFFIAQKVSYQGATFYAFGLGSDAVVWPGQAKVPTGARVEEVRLGRVWMPALPKAEQEQLDPSVVEAKKAIIAASTKVTQAAAAVGRAEMDLGSSRRKLAQYQKELGEVRAQIDRNNDQYGYNRGQLRDGHRYNPDGTVTRIPSAKEKSLMTSISAAQREIGERQSKVNLATQQLSVSCRELGQAWSVVQPEVK